MYARWRSTAIEFIRGSRSLITTGLMFLILVVILPLQIQRGLVHRNLGMVGCSRLFTPPFRENQPSRGDVQLLVRALSNQAIAPSPTSYWCLAQAQARLGNLTDATESFRRGQLEPLAPVYEMPSVWLHILRALSTAPQDNQVTIQEFQKALMFGEGLPPGPISQRYAAGLAGWFARSDPGGDDSLLYECYQSIAEGEPGVERPGVHVDNCPSTSDRRARVLLGHHTSDGWADIPYRVMEGRYVLGFEVDPLLIESGLPGQMNVYWRMETVPPANDPSWRREGSLWVHTQTFYNIAPNGGFEWGAMWQRPTNPVGYPIDYHARESTSRQVVVLPVDGRMTSVLRLRNMPERRTSSAVSVRLPVSPGKLYILSGRMRALDGNGHLGLTCWPRPGAPDIAYITAEQTERSWRTYAGIAPIPPEATQCHIVLTNFNSAGEVLYDDILLFELDAGLSEER